MTDDIITFGQPERGADLGPGGDLGRGAGPAHGSERKRATDEVIESLFHACYPRLVRTAFALVGDWDLAEQLAQEAYLRLWRRWRWIADPQAAPMYLQRTVVNLSRETIRRRVVERRVLKSRSMERSAQQPADTDAAFDLRRAIANLPVRKRECVILRYLLGMSEAETASALGISVGTVKSQTHKGLRQLRDELAEMSVSTRDGIGSVAGGGAAAGVQHPTSGKAKGAAR